MNCGRLPVSNARVATLAARRPYERRVRLASSHRLAACLRRLALRSSTRMPRARLEAYS